MPTALCVGLGAACQEQLSDVELESWRSLTIAFERELISRIHGARVNGAASLRHPGSINLTVPGADAEMLITRLQPRVALSRGSACTSGIPEPSHVLSAIGLSADESASTIQISTAPTTSRSEMAEAVELIVSKIHETKETSKSAA